MKKVFEKFAIGLIYSFCFFLVIELGTNYFAFRFLFPIKNDSSFGYVARKTGRTIIGLNKYSSRFKAQIALPFELVNARINDRELERYHDKETDLYGYKDKHGKIIIKHQFTEAREFTNDYAIVAIKDGKNLKYGTIDERGRWIIEPKYEYLCPFMKYYTRACVDKKHCGVIDRYGNEITLMAYTTDKLNCKGKTCGVKLCTVGKDNKEISCNYFL